MMAALSRFFDMWTSSMVSERFPAATFVDPTRKRFVSALDKPSRVSDPTIR